MGQRAFHAGQLSTVLGQTIRQHLEFSEGLLATRIGVSPDTMTRWLNGRSPINVDYFAAIAYELGISPGDLMREAVEKLSTESELSLRR